MNIEVRKLQCENVAIKHKMAALLDELTSEDDPLPCRLTVSEEIIARLIRSQSPKIVSRKALYAALYAFRVEADEPEMNTVDVLLSFVRRKLNRIGIMIITEWGRGWRMDAESVERWDTLSAKDGEHWRMKQASAKRG